MKYPEVKNYIGGNLIPCKIEKYWDKICPNDGSLLTKVPMSSKDDLADAVKVAEKAFVNWSDKTIKDRVQILFKYRTLLEKYIEDHARIIHEEIGKTFEEGRQEVNKS